MRAAMGEAGGETYGKLFTSSQAVGLLAVVAVSGSVALLTFGKQKLWQNLISAASCSAQDCQEQLLQHPLSNVPEQTKEENVSALRPSCSGRPAVTKKVRFAPDVVEPAGNGQEYRCRNRAVHKANSKKVWCEERPRKDDIAVAADSDGALALSSRFQSLPKPSLPANRMLLYSGMQRYKSQMALHCR